MKSHIRPILSPTFSWPIILTTKTSIVHGSKATMACCTEQRVSLVHHGFQSNSSVLCCCKHKSAWYPPPKPLNHIRDAIKKLQTITRGVKSVQSVCDFERGAIIFSHYPLRKDEPVSSASTLLTILLKKWFAQNCAKISQRNLKMFSRALQPPTATSLLAGQLIEVQHQKRAAHTPFLLSHTTGIRRAMSPPIHLIKIQPQSWKVLEFLFHQLNL